MSPSRKGFSSPRRRALLLGVVAAAATVTAFGVSWMVFYPQSTPPGPIQDLLPLDGLPWTESAYNQSTVGCSSLVGGAQTCFLLLIGPTAASTSTISSFFLLPANDTEVAVPVTLAGACVKATTSNGTVISASCTQPIAHRSSTGGWAKCTISLCGGTNSSSAATPPVPLQVGEAFIVQVPPPLPTPVRIGVVAFGGTFLYDF